MDALHTQGNKYDDGLYIVETIKEGTRTVICTYTMYCLLNAVMINYSFIKYCKICVVSCYCSNIRCHLACGMDFIYA